MITVSDILALPAFDEVTLIARCPRAGARGVHNVGILDCPPDYNEYSNYYPGEFIVTNLGFANNDAHLAEESLLAMMARNVSAIAIKTVYNPTITDAVKHASEACGVPVYIYTGAFHEMVAYQALDLIRRDELESGRNKVIDDLLESRSDERIRRKIYDIANITGATMNCFAIAPKASDDSSLYAVLGMVQAYLKSAESSFPEMESAFCCRYHGCVLALVSYETQEASAQTIERLARLLASGESLHCGVGEKFVLGNADLSIRQALSCLNEARKRNVAALSWKDLHEQAFAISAKADPLFAQTSAMYRSILRAYDEENDAGLTQTAHALADSLGDVKAAAAATFQHPNTIRYRLKKIKSLFGMDSSSDKEAVAFLLLVFITQK